MSYQSNQFEIRFATENDDAELLAILEETPMPGPIQLIYTRRPSPWLSYHREGQEVGILICRDKKNNCIVSLGVYAIKEMYINKIETRVAYLFSLRSLKKYRLKFPLKEGYEFLKNQLIKIKVDFIYTSIVEENTSAVNLFFKKHSGLPTYQKLFTYSTLCLNQQKVINIAAKKNNIRKAGIKDVEAVYLFMLTNGCQLSGFPKIKKEELLSPISEKFILNLYICFDQDNNMVGVMSVFNPSSYKQYVVVGYSWQIKIYNFFRKMLPLRSFPYFPLVNQSIENYFITNWLIVKNDVNILLDLIAFICAEKISRPFLIIGLPIESPYFETLDKLAYLNYKSNICQIYWENMNQQIVPTKPFYMECYSL